MRQLTDFERGYVCAFIDGEGSIRVQAQFSHGGRKRPWLNGGLEITNTNPTVIYWLKERIGGHVYIRKNHGNRRDCYRLVVTGKKLIPVLVTVRRGLMVKRRQADRVLELLTGGMDGTWLGRDGLPDREITRRLQLHREVRRLNRRGKSGA